MIVVSTADAVIASAREALQLSAGNNVDDDYWIATLRRLAGQLCPCSPRTLIALAVASHSSLIEVGEVLTARLEDIIDSLVVSGDLLELTDVTTLDETVKATWLFAAPPSFVLHPSGTAFLFGLATDDPMPLPAELAERVRMRGVIRTIAPLPREDLAALLKAVGLRALSLESWLKPPKKESPAAMLARLDARLLHQPPVGNIPDLRIFDWTCDARRYRDRWRGPAHQTGSFIVRRPQAYGADLWGYGRLNNGRLEALIDFPLPGTRWRGCDTAWRVQLAIDACAGRPQRYRVRTDGVMSQFDFFFPLPDWARRRLSTVGVETSPDRCLMSFRVPVSEAATEATFLHDFLFLEAYKQGGDGR
jgi:hypothetical protein